MRVLAWIAAGTWPAVVEALRGRAETDQLTLVTAEDVSESLPTGIFDSLIGRGRRGPVPEASGLTAAAARSLLDQAGAALGRPCERRVLSGPTERVITAALADADWFILARDGDRSRLGPASLGRHARFIIDHAPCTVELLWPETSPDLDTIPPPPARP